MSEAKFDRDRRTALKVALTTVAVVPLGTLLATRSATGGDLPPLSEDDTSAKALAYVHDASKAAASRKEGQFCKNCNLIQSKQGTWRPCSIFPGKGVNENGWCKAWVGRG